MRQPHRIVRDLHLGQPADRVGHLSLHLAAGVHRDGRADRLAHRVHQPDLPRRPGLGRRARAHLVLARGRPRERGDQAGEVALEPSDGHGVPHPGDVRERLAREALQRSGGGEALRHRAGRRHVRVRCGGCRRVEREAEALHDLGRQAVGRERRLGGIWQGARLGGAGAQEQHRGQGRRPGPRVPTPSSRARPGAVARVTRLPHPHVPLPSSAPRLQNRPARDERGRPQGTTTVWSQLRD